MRVIGNLEDVTKLDLTPQGTPPTPQKGSFYYDSTDDKYYGSTDGITWTEIGGSGGSGGGTNFASTTFTAQTSVTFNHSLGVKPLVQIFDDNDQVITPLSITHDSINQVTVTFSIAETGTITVVGGSGSANQVNWTHTQSTGSTTWTINHNLGAVGSFTVYDGSGNVLEYDSANATSNTLTITFASAETGSVELIAGSSNSNAVVTYAALNSNSDVGDQSDQVARGDHNHISLPNGGFISNLGISISGSTVSLTAKDGSALSASNAAHFVWPNDKENPGEVKELSLTSTKSFTFGASGNLSGQIWHTTDSVAWGSVLPLFIVAAYDTSDNIEIFLTPDLARMKTPSSSNAYGYHGNPSTNDDQNAFWAWNASDTSANFTSERPCILLGCVYATKDASNDWTISALEHEENGIGRFPWGVRFTMPPGQRGATSGKYGNNSGGTFPIFSTNNYTYEVHPNGEVTLYVYFDTVSTGGSGAPTLLIYMPYDNDGGYAEDYSHLARAVWSNGGTARMVGFRMNPDGVGSSRWGLRRTEVDAVLTMGDFITSSGRIAGRVRYKAFTRG